MIIDVTDLEIDVLNFKKSYDPERQRRGKRIYDEEDVTIKEVDKKTEEEYEVKARVNGNYDIYTTKLNINKKMINDWSCTCEDYYNGNICKHIIATSYEIIEPHRPSTKKGLEKYFEQIRKQYELQRQEEERKREYERKYNMALSAIAMYKKDGRQPYYINEEKYNNIYLKSLYEKSRLSLSENDSNTELATSIRLEPRLELNDIETAELTFKIGQKMMYVIKDIEQFAKLFENEDIIQFGKKLKFKAKNENFVVEDRELLKFIKESAKIIKYSEKIRENDYYRYSSGATKSIKLFDENIDDLMNILKNREREIEVSNYRIGQELYKITDENINLKLKIENKNGEYSLKINIKNYEYLKSKNYIYIFYNKKIYAIEKAKNEEIMNILKLFKYNQEILIPHDRFAEFSTYVLPKVNQYLESENLPAETVKEGLVVNKLASKIYLDLDARDDIMLELKFCYLDKEFNILDKEYEKYINENNIVRNIPEERNVLERLFKDGFELQQNKDYFILKNEDYIYEFLSEKINNYMNDFEVMATEKLKNRQIRKAQISNVSVKLDTGLLEVDISKMDIDIREIKDILKNYSIKKKYYKLKNGDFLSLEQNEDLDFLNNMANSLDVDFDKVESGIVKLPVNRSVYLEKLLEKNKNITSSKNDNFTKLINNIENKDFSDEIKVSKDFEKLLRDYQKTGYKWLKTLEQYGFGGILADDMGLGKTLQVIALINDEIKKKNKKTSIVVCPSSLVLNWKAEVEKWCNEINVLIIKGDANTRKNLINSYNEYDLLITSYDLLKRDVLEYENKQFKYIIADEAQYIKNSITQNATSLKSLEGEIKFALTGTPIENSIAELWSIFDFIMPRIFI